MKRRTWIHLSVILSLAMTLIATTFAAQAETGQGALAALGTSFTYQGRLTDGGSPASGAYDFEFRLYDALSGGSQVGGTVTLDDVSVTNGLFTVQLDFGSVFDGAALYLNIGVRPGASSGAYTALSPRQPLTAAPYALYALSTADHDHWGETWTGTTGSDGLRLEHAAASGVTHGVMGQSASTEGAGLFGRATASNGYNAGVWGQSDSMYGRGVYGYAANANGQNDGVYGVSESNSGRGVRGLASSTSGTTFGVYGESKSLFGSGVFGYASSYSGTTIGVGGASASTAGRGLYGAASAGSGTTFGVYGEADSTDGRGVFGWATAASGSTYGMIGQSASTGGRGVLGSATATSGLTSGVEGVSASTAGRGVYGHSTASSGYTFGVYGRSDSTQGYGVYGYAPATSGATYGVYGQSASPSGLGVYGEASATSGAAYGVYGQSASTSGRGVYGWANATSGLTMGVYGRSDSASGYGLYGIATAGGSGATYGVYGQSNSANGYGGYFIGYGADAMYVENSGSGRALQAVSSSNTAIWGRTDTGIAGVDGRAAGSTGRGVYGYATATSGANAGVYGRTASIGGRGVQGIAEATTGTNIGVYGETNSANGYAGYFADRVHVNGALSKAAGSFKIDHPLDPANQYLYHSFVESPDMKNIYDGVVALDGKGEATVTLPDWFGALNRDFRYQLTPIGAAMPDLHIAQKAQDNAFRIAGGVPGTEVSWQVTGIRQDAYANAHRIPIEEQKPADERGLYLHPTEQNQHVELGLDFQRNANRPQQPDAAQPDSP